MYHTRVHVKPQWLLDRDLEWDALMRFVARHQRLAVVYGPRRVGKSYLLDAACEAVGGYRYQAIRGVPAAQLSDFGQALGGWLGAGPLQLSGWTDALDRLGRIDAPVVVIDEFPYLTEAAPELTSMLQRYVDGKDGPSLILAGSSLSTMASLVSPQAPLYGRSAAVVVPAPFAGRDLTQLWEVDDPRTALWVDAAVGGLPGYRPLLAPPGTQLDTWMTDEVLAAASPLLDAAEAALGEAVPSSHRGLYQTILVAIAGGERSFSGIARVAGQASGALTRPLAALERAGLVTRVPDPLRSRRDTYDLADPHLRTWLTLVAPWRSQLQAGRSAEVWQQVKEKTWRSQVLGPRWEAVVRAFVQAGRSELGTVGTVGSTTVPDRAGRTGHEVDLVAMRGSEMVAVGEAKLRTLGRRDLDRLRRIRQLLGAPDAQLVLASAEGIEPDVASEPDTVTVVPSHVYS